MFQVSLQDIQSIMEDFGILSPAVSFSELQRHYYEKSDPNSKQVRLICRAVTAEGKAYVVRFKKEDDAPRELMEQQSRFAMELYAAGIPTPRVYQNGGCCIQPYTLHGYEVFVGVEEFVPGELKCVDACTARETGALLARTHNLAEENDLHVTGLVLFDPFVHNDLFAVDSFREAGDFLVEELKPLYGEILRLCERYIDILLPLRDRPRYAVQGDLSDCNMYRRKDGKLGIFDFNWCGDSVLFCDAVMQGMFVARNMDYPEELGENRMEIILASFWTGYRSVRELSREERQLYPYLMAVIDGFWSSDIRWEEDSLLNLAKAGDREGVHRRLAAVKEKLMQLETWQIS